MPTRQPGEPTPLIIPSDIREELLSPLARRAADILRAGGKIRPVEQVRWSPKLAAQIHSRVSEWLVTGHAEPLSSLLKEFPGALAHPAVSTSVIKMRRLAASVEVAELTGGAHVGGEFFSPEACRAARDALHSMAAAFLSGLIGHGWSFTRPPKRRGRPKRAVEEIAEAFDILGDYERVLHFLRAIETKRGKAESEKQWRERLRGIAVQAWTETIGIDIRSELPPSKGDIFASKIVSVPLKVPDRAIDRCLDKALQAAGSRLPVRDVIAYHLVGHRHSLAPSTIKTHVEQARKLDK